MENYEQAYARKRHLAAMSAHLAQALPGWFPARAGLSNIWEGVVTIRVDTEALAAEIRPYAEQILEALRGYGVTSAATVKVVVGKRQARSKPSERFHLSRLLGERPALASVQSKVARLREFNRRIADELGSPFPEGAQVANVKEGVITVIASNSAVATQLRYLQREIIEVTRRIGVTNIHSVKVRVTPKVEKAEPVPRRAAAMSGENSEAIRQTAECMEEGSLKSALLKLSKRNR
jgi:hypothetical protein